ncbi:hypothetical protein ACG83_16865 [Frankia sp. R43]|uniref:hypothetical protein n=1 Tax=Frankia sp. R43 TaxID=269536 RepID=UPI0006CA5A8B|nr:hypothetical protein [Frankia sp. R43]KPM55018.1 hypothetical protein ACG83_16865 [Frankia sp. R43]
MLLDCVAVVGSFAFVGAALVLPHLDENVGAPVPRDLLVVTSVGDLVVAAVVVLLVSFRSAPPGGALYLLLASSVALIEGKVGYLLLGSYGPRVAAPLNILLLLSSLFVALAAAVAPHRDEEWPSEVSERPGGQEPSVPSRRPASQRPVRLWAHAVVPYLAVAVVGLVILVTAFAGASLTTVESGWIALLPPGRHAALAERGVSIKVSIREPGAAGRGAARTDHGRPAAPGPGRPGRERAGALSRSGTVERPGTPVPGARRPVACVVTL